MRAQVRLSLSFITILLLQAPLAFGVTNENKQELKNLSSEIQRLAAKDDNLGVRVLIRRLARLRKTPDVWLDVRKTLHRYPSCGWDILWAWERMRPPEMDSFRFLTIDEMINSGDKLMKTKDYEGAFEEYQAAAKAIKKDLDKSFHQNDFLYQSVLHSAGQALFSAGRYEDAYTVLSWISPTYSKFKQVLFERMWSGFRAGKLDLASGAIAAQYSSFWGHEFIEPESYLMQIYVYRKLCRSADLKLVLTRLREFERQIKSGEFGPIEWAKSDPENFFFARMLTQPINFSSSLVTKDDRLEERGLVVRLLSDKFKIARPRLISELEKVAAYTNLAFSSSSKEFPSVRKLPSQDELFHSGKEMWPVDDAEDWLDELGYQTFIGQSECREQKSPKH